MKQSPSTLAAAFLALCASACGNSASPTTPTAPSTPTAAAGEQPVQNPTITNFSVSPTFGVSELTLITMSAAATDPNNLPLTYAWTYGNTTVNNSATTSATFTGDGNVTAQVTVVNSKGGTATRSQSVTVGTMTGTWNLNVDRCGGSSNPATLTLSQSGTSVTGTIYFPTQWCNVTPRSGGTFKQPGTIDDKANVQMLRIAVTSGIVGSFLEVQLKGQLDSTGRKVIGVIDQSGFRNDPMTMTKQ